MCRSKFASDNTQMYADRLMAALDMDLSQQEAHDANCVEHSAALVHNGLQDGDALANSGSLREDIDNGSSNTRNINIVSGTNMAISPWPDDPTTKHFQKVPVLNDVTASNMHSSLAASRNNVDAESVSVMSFFDVVFGPSNPQRRVVNKPSIQGTAGYRAQIRPTNRVTGVETSCRPVVHTSEDTREAFSDIGTTSVSGIGAPVLRSKKKRFPKFGIIASRLLSSSDPVERNQSARVNVMSISAICSEPYDHPKHLSSHKSYDIEDSLPCTARTTNDRTKLAGAPNISISDAILISMDQDERSADNTSISQHPVEYVPHLSRTCINRDNCTKGASGSNDCTTPASNTSSTADDLPPRRHHYAKWVTALKCPVEACRTTFSPLRNREKVGRHLRLQIKSGHLSAEHLAAHKSWLDAGATVGSSKERHRLDMVQYRLNNPEKTRTANRISNYRFEGRKAGFSGDALEERVRQKEAAYWVAKERENLAEGSNQARRSNANARNLNGEQDGA